MVKIFSFAAVRPRSDRAADIASVPYDVVSTGEARECIEQNPLSFMKVIRSESTMPGVDPKDPCVYETARKNIYDMIESGLLVKDEKPGIYLYRVKQGGSIYTGFVADVAVSDYEENKIKRHELTRYEKEEDRTAHIDTTNANTGLVVLLYRDPGEIFPYIESLIPDRKPDGLAKTDAGVVHEVFRVDDEEAISKLTGMFEQVDALYIADGHHRAKSSVNVAEKRKKEGRFTEESGKFMAVIFSEERVKIHGYSRLVADLGDFTQESFLKALSEKFDVRPYGEIDDTVFRIPPLKESEKPVHVFHMYIGRTWYELSCPVSDPEDTIASLDVSVLQKEVMENMLGIEDPRGDPRLQYLGGSRPLSDLQMRVDSGSFAFAFSMQPVSVDTVLKIADEEKIMPPKSTWFEPKLLSGLTIHLLE